MAMPVQSELVCNQQTEISSAPEGIRHSKLHKKATNESCFAQNRTRICRPEGLWTGCKKRFE
jgi:hypothetical protein